MRRFCRTWYGSVLVGAAAGVVLGFLLPSVLAHALYLPEVLHIEALQGVSSIP